MAIINKNNPMTLDINLPDGASDAWYEVKRYRNTDTLSIIERTDIDDYEQLTISLTDAQVEVLRNDLRSDETQELLDVYVHYIVGGKNKKDTYQCYYQLEEDDTTKPSITFSVEPVNTGVLAGHDVFVQHRSKIALSFSASAKYGSTIRSCYAEANYQVYEPGNHEIDTVGMGNEIVVHIVAVDTRWMRREITATYQIESVVPPSLVPVEGFDEISCTRSGTNALLSVGTRFSSLKDGDQELNSCTLAYRYRPSSQSEFTSWDVLSMTNGEYNSTLPISISESASYVVEVSATDIFDSVSTSFYIPTGKSVVSMNEEKTGIAIGKMCEGSGLEVDWPARFNKEVSFSTIKDLIVYEGYMDSSDGGTWFVRRWQSGIMECFSRHEVTNITCNSAWGSLFSHNTGISLAYPIEFIYPPELFATPITNGYSFFLVCGTDGGTTGTGEWYFARPTSIESMLAGISFYAIGRWKGVGE